SPAIGLHLLVDDLAALLLALLGGGRDHALALARVDAGTLAIRPGADALALAGVDTGTVHQLVAGLVLGGARAARARQDETRGGGRDQQSLSAHRGFSSRTPRICSPARIAQPVLAKTLAVRG